MKIIKKENYVSPVVKSVSVRMESAMLVSSPGANWDIINGGDNGSGAPGGI